MTSPTPDLLIGLDGGLLITVTIPGTPQQQGSKIATRTGVMFEANKKLRPWRAEGIAAAQAAYDGPRLDGPLWVGAEFLFARPQSHYRTGRFSNLLKPNAPLYMESAPDLDKLQRAVGDMLTQAGTILDDRKIVRWSPIKVYTERAPRTIVRIRPIGN